MVRGLSWMIIWYSYFAMFSKIKYISIIKAKKILKEIFEVWKCESIRIEDILLPIIRRFILKEIELGKCMQTEELISVNGINVEMRIIEILNVEIFNVTMKLFTCCNIGYEYANKHTSF
jgi:hypothetical protein